MQAAVVVSTSLDSPLENIALSNVASGTIGNSNAYKKGDGSAATGIGQAFTVGASSIEMAAITWKIAAFNAGVLSKTFNISIYEASAVNASGTETLISSQVGVLPGSGLSVGEYITFSLGQSVTLESGKIYGILFSFVDATSPDNTAKSLGFEVGTVYQPGTRLWVINDVTGVISADTKESTFFLQSAAPIPEPSTYTLIGLSVLALVILRKRRHA